MASIASDLAGRDAALGELSRALDAAIAGSGGSVLVTGEAGIGKTAVAAAVASAARAREVRVLWAAAWAGEGAPGLWLWMQVARELAPDRRWPAEPAADETPAASRFRLADELAGMLGAAAP